MVDLETGKCPHDCGISGNFLFFSPLSRICLPAALALFITFLFFLRGRRVVLVMAESTMQEGNAKCIMCGHCYGSAQGRQHGRSFKCWNCLNVEQTMRRHLGTTADLADFSQAETENFFRKPRARRAQMTRALLQPLQWHSASYSHRFPKWKKEDGQLALMPLHMLRGQEPFRLIRPDRSGVWLLR